MTNKTLPQIVNDVYVLLEPLDSDHRQKVVGSVMTLLGEETKSRPVELFGDGTSFGAKAQWTHPGKVEAPYTVCIASASNLTGLVKSSVECRRTGL